LSVFLRCLRLFSFCWLGRVRHSLSISSGFSLSGPL
jgi:hypothetical protein